MNQISSNMYQFPQTQQNQQQQQPIQDYSQYIQQYQQSQQQQYQQPQQYQQQRVQNFQVPTQLFASNVSENFIDDAEIFPISPVVLSRKDTKLIRKQFRQLSSKGSKGGVLLAIPLMYYEESSDGDASDEANTSSKKTKANNDTEKQTHE